MAVEPGSQRSAEQAPVQQYRPGTQVQHPTWGEGMVLNSNFQDGDEIVDVFFKGHGLKRLVASLARLEFKL